MRRTISTLFLHASPLAQQVDEDGLLQMVAAAKLVKYSAGAYVVRQGSEGDRMFLVHKGRLIVKVGDDIKRTIEEGQSFGEVLIAVSRILKEKEILSLLGSLPWTDALVRTADVISEENTELLEWTIDSISPILDAIPRMEYNLQKIGLRRLEESVQNGSQEGRRLLTTISAAHPLLRTGMFEGIESHKTAEVLKILTSAPRLVLAGQHVIWSGERGNSLFAVVSGLLDCRIEGKEIRQIGPGQFFGEVSLCANILTSERASVRRQGPIASSHALSKYCFRTADVVCLEDAILIELSSSQMEAVFEIAPKVQENLHRVAIERLLESTDCISVQERVRHLHIVKEEGSVGIR